MVTKAPKNFHAQKIFSQRTSSLAETLHPQTRVEKGKVVILPQARFHLFLLFVLFRRSISTPFRRLFLHPGSCLQSRSEVALCPIGGFVPLDSRPNLVTNFFSCSPVASLRPVTPSDNDDPFRGATVLFLRSVLAFADRHRTFFSLPNRRYLIVDTSEN